MDDLFIKYNKINGDNFIPMPLAELIDLRKGQEGGCGGRGLTGERVTGGGRGRVCKPLVFGHVDLCGKKPENW